MIHDHACIGAAATYSAAIALGLFVSVLAFGMFLAGYAAAAVWTRLARLWARLGEVEESRRVKP